ncbi:hypothetical protein [Winogradskyella forsetii]|uniref:hypothetical protein n=1 Tax=Winogradskyella forsetii TaxID=2686077 RepID=UPI0015BE246E|nr:hypothetical protein [Winogradskyella forsetii]
MKTIEIKSDLTGQTFSRLKVLSYEGRNKQYDSLWKCECDCGTIKTIRGGVLKNGHTQSCGCLQKERTSVAKTTHGLINDNYKLYKVWIGIKQRCNNPNSKSYTDYGGRGIKICNEWENSFEVFHKWAIEEGYKIGLTIERVLVDGNYEPSNCKWIHKKWQSKNRTSSVLITHEGETKSASEWSELTRIPSKVITQRIRRGWNSKKTLTTKI